MRKGGSYQKGRKTEQEVARLFTNLSGVKYKRTPLSGGMRQEYPFDIHKIGYEPSKFDGIGIEVKNQAKLNIPDWIKQIDGECEDAGYSDFSKKWVIVFNWKGKFYFLLNQSYFEKLND